MLCVNKISDDVASSLKNINEKIKNRSYPLNPQQFPKAFELNDDYA